MVDVGFSEPRDGVAEGVARGVSRLLVDMGYTPLTELTLHTGRRVDVIGLNAKGKLIIVEIKSSKQDFQTDQKWREYLDHCDLFYFAVPTSFDVDLLPEDVGLMIGDSFGAEIIRASDDMNLHSSRRRSVLLRFARVASGRLYGVMESARDVGWREDGASQAAWLSDNPE